MENIFKVYPNIVEQMKNTPQDPKWHKEGNVYIHTVMVYEQLLKLEEFNTLSEEEQEILKYAAVFHDLGKIHTTKKDDNGNIVSPNHSRVGGQEFRKLFFDKMDIKKREAIVQLINNHQKPIWFFEQEEYKIVELADIVNVKLLYLLAKADILGRISEDQEDFLYQVEEFKHIANRFNVFGKRKNFLSEDSRLNFYKSGSEYFSNFSKSSTMFLMVGLPASGKDTFIKNNEELSSLPIVSLDSIRNNIKRKNKKDEGRVKQEAKKQMKEFLANKQDFVFNATNIRKEQRKQLIDLALSYNAKVHIVYVEIDWKNLIKNLNKRNELILQGKVKHPYLNEEDLKQYVNKLEVPTLNEAHFLSFV